MMVLLCGMMASGKSTLTRRLANKGYITVNDDSVVMACHGGDHTLYDKKFKGIYKQIETASIVAALQIQVPLVIDRPNFKRMTRARYIGLAKMFDMPVVCVVFPKESPLVHAERRFQSDPRGRPLEYWVEAASVHHALWEDPHIQEGFDNIVPESVAMQMIEEGKL